MPELQKNDDDLESKDAGDTIPNTAQRTSGETEQENAVSIVENRALFDTPYKGNQEENYTIDNQSSVQKRLHALTY